MLDRYFKRQGLKLSYIITRHRIGLQPSASRNFRAVDKCGLKAIVAEAAVRHIVQNAVRQLAEFLSVAKSVTGYSPVQVALHWIVLVLVAFQYVAHDGVEESWRAFQRSEAAPADTAVLTNMHIVAGVLVLVLAMARIYLRVTRGAPSPPSDEPWLLKFFAEAVHRLIYVLLFLLPFSGAVAWFFAVEAAGAVHGLLTNLLLGAIALHVTGALFQHFVRRSDVLMRMLKPERS